MINVNIIIIFITYLELRPLSHCSLAVLLLVRASFTQTLARNGSFPHSHEDENIRRRNHPQRQDVTTGKQGDSIEDHSKPLQLIKNKMLTSLIHEVLQNHLIIL